MEQRKNDEVLWSIVERSGKNLTNNEKVKFFELLSTYESGFMASANVNPISAAISRCG